MRSQFKAMARRIKAAASAIDDAIRQTHAARLAIMAAKLRRALPLIAMLLLATLLLCLFLAWSSARGVFLVLSPASPTGIMSCIAAVVAGIAVLELCAAFAITIMTAALQLAYDTGRHCVLALLALASALGLALMVLHLSAEGMPALAGSLLPTLSLCGLIVLTLWFKRAYLRPAYPGFRDFWADIVEARHFLMRAAHGE
ncbi:MULTISPECIES: hypothetical protein [Bosea]|uniref:hypothetical protein n=1 Tax=Bosea TaxID=85413 RepID=UPI00214F8478|nr:MULTISPECIES: hypothetical protein [Bosea]MCR4522572.1 hypothetical protein [Bosea sp. 47.2.35]MDR6827078.1 hypothetical protein [Bosea robiniae]MDR6893788.1 hypothetical protein [Bosea sp. BE109]MDR7136512.1 hypothetical protein [Bosea sp. BE168]MDR7173211.1 hypothetical protein [Bosea sp. BE271]